MSDPFVHARETHSERLNRLAQTVQASWIEFVPLSVRYAAAEAAEAIVEEYMSNVSDWSVGFPGITPK